MSLRTWYRAGVGYVRDGMFYLKHKIKGTSYREYYAERMNRLVQRNPRWGLNLNKRFQLDYLIGHGLRPNHSMLDYGCGALAAGIHFIEYLSPGHYVGVDISDGVIAEGRRRLAERGLEGKRPELYVIRGASLAPLAERRFDVVWAQSVLTHMPPADVEDLLNRLRRHLSAGGVFYATFALTEGENRQRRFKDWYYTRDFFAAVAAKYSLRLEFMPDWRHPDDLDGVDTLAKFSLTTMAR